MLVAQRTADGTRLVMSLKEQSLMLNPGDVIPMMPVASAESSTSEAAYVFVIVS